MAPLLNLPPKRGILILEDETITAHYLRRILTSLGYQLVGVAADARSALDLMAENKPDLLLADIGLEGDVDGIEVAIQARRLFDVPTVFITAYSDPDTLRRAKLVEPRGYLVKPIAEHELHSTVERALAQTGGASSKTESHVSAAVGGELASRLACVQINLEKLWQQLPLAAQDAHRREFLAIVDSLAALSIDLGHESSRLI